VICADLIACSVKLPFHAAEHGQLSFVILGYDWVYSLIPLCISVKSVKFSKVSNNLKEVSLK